jgi:hypothetical protein
MGPRTILGYWRNMDQAQYTVIPSLLSETSIYDGSTKCPYTHQIGVSEGEIANRDCKTPIRGELSRIILANDNSHSFLWWFHRDLDLLLYALENSVYN